MEDANKLTTKEIVVLTVVGGAAVYATLELGKLGIAWIREGIRTVNAKKSQNQD